MIKFIAVLTGTILGACTGQEPVDEAIPEAEIMMAIEAQQIAWNEGNIEGFVDWYTKDDELRFTTSRGTIRGSDQLLERYRESYPNGENMGTLTFSINEFVLIDEGHAVVIGKWALIRESDSPEGYFTLLWKKYPEGWRIAIDHTS